MREERTRPGRRRAGRLADAASLTMRSLLRPPAARGWFAPGPAHHPGPPLEVERGRRLALIQVDGVSRTRLERALADGRLPHLATRLEAGGHVLSSCRSGAPASTPAFQAGLFYGRSPSVPGFAWFDRATGREVRMDRAADAAELERRLSDGRSGLLRGGTSYFSIFSGDAALPHFCISGLAGELALGWEAQHLGPWDALASTLAHSVTAARTAYRLAHEIGTGLVDGIRWSMALGRMKHEPRFFAHRLLISALLRELAIQGILVDLSRGIPVLYADFLGFDETAHRRGPDSGAALRQLGAIDGALAGIFAEAEAAPPPGYDVYVLSDHGHVATRPFETCAGVPLGEFVARAERGEPLPRGPAPGSPHHALLGGRSLGGSRAEGIATAEAGDLAHVYFLADGDGPLPLDAVRARHWRVVAALSACRAVGIVAARGGRRGFALVRGAVLDLADPQDVARLPHPDPSLVATYLTDLLSIRESGDLVLFGWRGEGRDVAYAWEFGSHGGIAPEELESFVIHPASCRFQFERVRRPSELHRFFETSYRARPDEVARGEASPP